jgi:hypothetical protein
VIGYKSRALAEGCNIEADSATADAEKLEIFDSAKDLSREKRNGVSDGVVPAARVRRPVRLVLGPSSKKRKQRCGSDGPKCIGRSEG